jgi:hypothetical protein
MPTSARRHADTALRYAKAHQEKREFERFVTLAPYMGMDS